MGLFDQILGAIDNPNQQANPGQLGSILSAVQQMSGQQGLDPSSTQDVLSVVGGYVRSGLQQQRNEGGNERVESIVNQYGGTNPNADAVQALFSAGQQQQIVDTVAQRLGLNPETVRSLLPVVVPIALNLLKTGSTAQGSGSPGSNSVLSSFLDSDGDGDVDLGDTMSLANRYLQNR